MSVIARNLIMEQSTDIRNLLNEISSHDVTRGTFDKLIRKIEGKVTEIEHAVRYKGGAKSKFETMQREINSLRSELTEIKSFLIV